MGRVAAWGRLVGAGLLAACVAGCELADLNLPAIDLGIQPPPPAAPPPVIPARAIRNPDILPPPEAPPPVEPTVTMRNPDDVKYYPSDEPLRMGVEHFSRGNYGIAEHYFRDAVEKAPKDATAWIGLAASYDRLRRFDLADRAYAQVRRLTGETVQLLNDEGYSFMLRGNYRRARELFLRANKIDPGNPTIINNLQLLDGSSRFINRPVDPPSPQ
jgi:tetratricopeptide (TPR) repeat protein